MTARALGRPTRYLMGAGSLALALGAGPVVLSGTAWADAKGSLTVHAEGTSIEDENNEPHLCTFRLVADNYDNDASLTYDIDAIAPSEEADDVLTGTITLTGGVGQTEVLSLPDGHYKANAQQVGENGADNFKVFWVDCEDTGGGTGGETTGGDTTGGDTTGGDTTGGDTTGGDTTGGDTTGGDTTGGETTGGETTGGDTTGGDTTGGDFTGGGGGTVVVNQPQTGGGGTVTLPLTGDRTRGLAAVGLMALLWGVAFHRLGTRGSTTS